MFQYIPNNYNRRPWEDYLGSCLYSLKFKRLYRTVWAIKGGGPLLHKFQENYFAALKIYSNNDKIWQYFIFKSRRDPNDCSTWWNHNGCESHYFSMYLQFFWLFILKKGNLKLSLWRDSYLYLNYHRILMNCLISPLIKVQTRL